MFISNTYPISHPKTDEEFLITSLYHLEIDCTPCEFENDDDIYVCDEVVVHIDRQEISTFVTINGSCCEYYLGILYDIQKENEYEMYDLFGSRCKHISVVEVSSYRFSINCTIHPNSLVPARDIIRSNECITIEE